VTKLEEHLGIVGRGKDAAMAKATVVKISDAPVFERGDGVLTTLLVGKGNAVGTVFTSGLTRFPPGRSAPMHSHNCGEQVILLEGEGAVEVDGKVTRLERYDTTYIPANVPHRFHATGDAPMLIMWIYGADHVTRTFTETGKTVEHLSGGDTVRPA
jgi:quercetin dioxygenase-like cupin family protein